MKVTSQFTVSCVCLSAAKSAVKQLSHSRQLFTADSYSQQTASHNRHLAVVYVYRETTAI